MKARANDARSGENVSSFPVRALIDTEKIAGVWRITLFKWGNKMDTVIAFRKLPEAEEAMRSATNGIMETLIRDHSESWIKAMEKLTVQQFAEVIAQAIKSGDFINCIQSMAGNGELKDVSTPGKMSFQSSQQVTYLPYRESMQLKSRISELEKIMLKCAMDLKHLACGPMITGIAELMENTAKGLPNGD